MLILLFLNILLLLLLLLFLLLLAGQTLVGSRNFSRVQVSDGNISCSGVYVMPTSLTKARVTTAVAGSGSGLVVLCTRGED